MEALPTDLQRTIAMLNLGMCVLATALAYPMLRGMVTRNRLYGFRTRRSLSSDEEWYKANKLGGKCIIVGSCAVAAFNLAVMGIDLPIDTAITGQLVLYSTPAGLVIAALVALLLHHRS